jgi:outer membrane receptor for ferrienterochelin and colicins
MMYTIKNRKKQLVNLQLKSSFAILCFFSLSIFPANAQHEGDIYDISLDSLWNIKVSEISRYTQSEDKTLNSFIVITQQQIESRGYQDLSDVLKDIPGFDISDNASRYGEYLTLRGIQGNERILVLIDGHKLNPPTGTLLSNGNSISVRFAKQIEITFGPASAMYGADAFSGIINIISKDIYKNKVNTVISGSYASMLSVDAKFESHFNLNDKLHLTLFGRMFQSEGFDVVGTDTIFNIIKRYKSPYKTICEQPIKDFTFLAKANYKAFTISYFRQMFDEGNALGLNPDKYVYSKDNKWQFNSDIFSIIYSKKFEYLGTLNIDLNCVSYKLNKNTQFIKWIEDNRPDSSFSQYMTGFDLAFKGTIYLHKVFSENFQLIGGTEFERIKSIPPYANDQLFGNSLKYEGSLADSINTLLTLFENRICLFGQINWTPFKKLNLVAGGRYDYSSHYGSTFNPRIGFSFNPFKKSIIRFVFGTAFQAPSLFFQYEQWGTSSQVMLSVSEVQSQIDPNWKLNNQRVSTYEFSYTQKIGKSIQAKLSTYYNYLTDIIQRVTFDLTDNTYNKYYNKLSNGIRNENIGIQTIKGLNLELKYTIENKFEAYAYYCYTNGISQEDSENTDIPRISENKFWIGVSYNNLFKIINISPRIRWIGEINNLNLTAFPNGKQKGYKCIDLYISVNQIIKNTKLFFQANNLLNSKIEQAGLFQQSGAYLPVISEEAINIKFGIEFNLSK